MLREALLMLAPALAFGQSAPPRAFEAASIKLHEGPMPSIGVSTSGLRLTADAATVYLLVMYAYNLKGFQVDGTAPLLNDPDTRWDILAKAEGDSVPTKAEFREMLKALLTDRFRLQVHREMREMPVYALVVGKNGLKLKGSAPDADPTSRFHQDGRNMEVTLPKASTNDIVNALEGTAFLGRPVVDRTGLTGTYDVKLTYTPATRVNRSTPDINDRDPFLAVEQLGLKLEGRKEPIEILVVDRVEKPSAN